MAFFDKIGIMLLLLIILVACQQAPLEIKTQCNSPYFEWQKGQCCLDANQNSICDEHETTIVQERIKEPVPEIIPKEPIREPLNEAIKVEQTTEVSKTLMQQMIDKAPKAYLFTNFNDNTGALVVNDRRSDGYVEYEFAMFWCPMSWDVNTKSILMTAPRQISERWYNYKHDLPQPKESLGETKYFPAYFEINLTGDPEQDLPRIPKELGHYYWSANMENKVRSPKFQGDRLPLIYFDSFYTKGPVDMMQEYALEEPIKIDQKPTIISSAGKQITTNLSISFKKKGDPSKILVFRFDPKLNVPLLIEETDQKGSIITRTEFGVETTVTYQGKRNTPIIEKYVQPLPGYMIITIEEYEEYKEVLENGNWEDFENR